MGAVEPGTRGEVLICLPAQGIVVSVERGLLLWFKQDPLKQVMPREFI